MRRLPGITVVAALTVLVSAVPAQATRPEDRVAWPWKHPAPFTTATSPDAVTDTPSPTGTRARSGRQAAFAGLRGRTGCRRACCSRSPIWSPAGRATAGCPASRPVTVRCTWSTAEPGRAAPTASARTRAATRPGRARSPFPRRAAPAPGHPATGLETDRPAPRPAARGRLRQHHGRCRAARRLPAPHRREP